MSCNICIEPFNKSTHKRVDCWCEYDCCKTCAKQYVLSVTEEAFCMNCKKQWNRHALVQHFGVTWTNTVYKKHLEKILLERELVRMPETMGVIQQRRERKQAQERIKEIEKQKYGLFDTRYALNSMIKDKHFCKKSTEASIQDFVDQLKERVLVRSWHPLQEIRKYSASNFTKKQLQEQSKLLTTQLNALNIRIRNVQVNRYAHLDEREIKPVKEFIRHCPDNDCRGFLSTALKCELCGIFGCGQCREIKGRNTEEINEHTCDPNTVETIKLMKKDTKPCPKCGKNIFKISGCSQMYCTPQSGGCGTAFNWNTLQICQGMIHNPHYFEWQRQNGGGRPIGGGIGGVDLCGRNQRHWGYSYFPELVRSVGDMTYRNRFPITNSNQDLRIKYLENAITKQQLEITIQRRAKSN